MTLCFGQTFIDIFNQNLPLSHLGLPPPFVFFLTAIWSSWQLSKYVPQLSLNFYPARWQIMPLHATHSIWFDIDFTLLKHLAAWQIPLTPACHLLYLPHAFLDDSFKTELCSALNPEDFQPNTAVQEADPAVLIQALHADTASIHIAGGAGTSAQNVSQAGAGGSFCPGNPRTETSRCIPSEVAFQRLRVCSEKICNTLAHPHTAANTCLHICTLLTLNALIIYNVFFFFFGWDMSSELSFSCLLCVHISL